jgi:CO/xanthine dehydrogenase Mo-binding subunit
LGLPLTCHGYFDPDTTPLDPDTGKGRPYGAFAFAAQTAEVEVNTLTGEVKCLRLAAAHDVGRAVNPQMVHGQVFGGAAMGLGFALMEEYVPGATESFKDYHIPTCADIPEFTSHIVEEPEPSGPFGAKGVGEPALIPTAPAILNAIADALGERIYELPANLERTLKAAKSKRSQIMTALDDDLCE